MTASGRTISGCGCSNGSGGSGVVTGGRVARTGSGTGYLPSGIGRGKNSMSSGCIISGFGCSLGMGGSGIGLSTRSNSASVHSHSSVGMPCSRIFASFPTVGVPALIPMPSSEYTPPATRAVEETARRSPADSDTPRAFSLLSTNAAGYRALVSRKT